jgi:hypothetical protein
MATANRSVESRRYLTDDGKTQETDPHLQTKSLNAISRRNKAPRWASWCPPTVGDELLTYKDGDRVCVMNASDELRAARSHLRHVNTTVKYAKLKTMLEQERLA